MPNIINVVVPNEEIEAGKLQGYAKVKVSRQTSPSHFIYQSEVYMGSVSWADGRMGVSFLGLFLSVLEAMF